EITSAAVKLGSEWQIADGKLRRELEFADFSSAIRFVSRVAELAEEVDHHPDLHIYYKRIVVELMTHKFNGLSVKDFALATQIEQLFHTSNTKSI
ncbi:MAG: 4a-hydroxytetrahydrobiopterin dehydratase, partial [Candidatus Andersenbacteria bacterium]|nr:4a-hydroxytetrahydrobiopterin dehydratase [Candidatus Andersenbacteria bacterium]